MTPLSLVASLGLALQGNPDLVSAGRDLDAAQADVVTARGSWDPSFTAASTWTNSESSGYVAGSPVSATSSTWDSSMGLVGSLPTGTDWELSTSLDRDRSNTTSSLGGTVTEQLQDSWVGDLSIGLRQDLLAPVRASSDKQTVTLSLMLVSEAEIARRSAEEEALSDVADAWWSWWTATESVGVAEKAVDTAKALEATTQAWLDEGETTRTELSRVKAARLEAESDLLQAQTDARAAADDLLLTLGLPPGQELVPGDAATPTLDAAADAVDEDTVLAENLELALARRTHERMQTSRAFAGDDMLPELDLLASAGVRSREEDPGSAASALVGEGALPSTSIGLELTIPLGNRSARGARDRAELERAQAEDDVATAERSVRAQLRAAQDELRTAEQAVALAEARLEMAQATEDGERAQFDEGAHRTDELLDAIDDRLAAEADLLSAQADVGRARLDLVALRGGLASLVRALPSETP